MKSYNNFHWEDNKLYLGKEFVGEVVPAHEEEMFRIKWPDGVTSADFYNKTRSKNNLRMYVMRERNLDENT